MNIDLNRVIINFEDKYPSTETIRNILREFFPEEKAERNLLVAVYDTKYVKELSARSYSQKDIDEAVVAIMNETFIDERHVREALEAWLKAYHQQNLKQLSNNFIQPNTNEALKWLRKAAELGNQEAMLKLSELLMKDNEDQKSNECDSIVIGVGGMGGGFVRNVIRKKVLNNVKYVLIDTDAQALSKTIKNDNVITCQIGKILTRGLGSRGSIKWGKGAYIESKDTVLAQINPSKNIFICCGLGGGCSGILPDFIGDLLNAKAENIYLLLTTPFRYEGKPRESQKDLILTDICKLLPRKNIYVFDNQSLLMKVSGETTVEAAFNIVDDEFIKIIREIVRGSYPEICQIEYSLYNKAKGSSSQHNNIIEATNLKNNYVEAPNALPDIRVPAWLRK